jgi:hypothetical protein
MTNRADMQTNIALMLGTTENESLSTAELNEAITQAVGDLSKYVPLQSVKELIIVVDVTAELKTDRHLSSDTATLNNKPIKWGSVSITNSAATTTYVEDTDYTIDYIAGTIDTSMSGGAIGATQDILVTYKIDQRIVDLGTHLTNPIEITEIEYPVRAGVQEFSNIEVRGDYLILTTFGGKSQESGLSEDQHIRIWYNAIHTDPGDSTNGSFPRYLDTIVQQGAAGYACRILAAQKMELAVAAIAVAVLDYARGDDEDSNFAIAVADMHIKLDLCDNVLAGLSVPLLDCNDALDKVTTHVAQATADLIAVATELTAVTTDLAEVPIQLTAGSASTEIDLVQVLARVGAALDTLTTASTPQAAANTALNLVTGSVNAGTNTPLGKISSLITDDGGQSVDHHLDESDAAITKALTDLANTLDNLEDDDNNRDADTYLDLGDAKLNTVTVGGSPQGAVRDYAEYAQVKIAMAAVSAQSGATHIAASQAQIAAARERFNGATAFVSEANSRVSVGNANISEAQARIAHAQSIMNDATVELNAAQVVTAVGVERRNIALAFISASTQRLSMSTQRLSMSTQRLSMATAFTNEAMGRLGHADRILARSNALIAQGQGYFQEGQLRLQNEQLRLQKGQGSIEVTQALHQGGAVWAQEGERRLELFWRALRDRQSISSQPVVVSRYQPD